MNYPQNEYQRIRCEMHDFLPDARISEAKCIKCKFTGKLVTKSDCKQRQSVAHLLPKIMEKCGQCERFGGDNNERK